MAVVGLLWLTIKVMTSKQKMRLIDLVDFTIIPAISEDLGIWDKDSVNEALSFLVQVLNNEKMK